MGHEGRKGREGNNLSEVSGPGMHQPQCPSQGQGWASIETSEELAAMVLYPHVVYFFHHTGDRGPCSSLACARVATLRGIRHAGHVSQARAGLRATSQSQLQPAELPDVP